MPPASTRCCSERPAPCRAAASGPRMSPTQAFPRSPAAPPPCPQHTAGRARAAPMCAGGAATPPTHPHHPPPPPQNQPAPQHHGAASMPRFCHTPIARPWRQQFSVVHTPCPTVTTCTPLSPLPQEQLFIPHPYPRPSRRHSCALPHSTPSLFPFSRPPRDGARQGAPAITPCRTHPNRTRPRHERPQNLPPSHPNERTPLAIPFVCWRHPRRRPLPRRPSSSGRRTGAACGGGPTAPSLHAYCCLSELMRARPRGGRACPMSVCSFGAAIHFSLGPPHPPTPPPH